ncbi:MULTISPECIES: hypothetical protein [Mucilaginibacter]|nr:hypothetical protein [Mucilaginibacter flavidus]MCO5949227.1 hypothetical protein [Mucilaginibacter flavidus]
MRNRKLLITNGKSHQFTHAFVGFPSADKLRAKAEKTAGLCVGQGIGNFCMQGLRGMG